MRIPFIAVAALAIAFLASCGWTTRTIEGSGTSSTVEHDLAEFSRVSVHADLDVELLFDSNRSIVEVTTDDNLHEHLRVDIDGDRLVIEPDEDVSLDPTGTIVVQLGDRRLVGLRATSDSKITADLPAVDELLLRASSDAKLEVEIDVDHLMIDVSSDGRVAAVGSAETARIDASSDGQARLAEIELVDAVVDGSSDASIHLTATGRVTGEASSDADVRVGGGAALDVRTSSDGSVSRTN